MSWWTVLRDGLRRPRAGSGTGTADLPVQRHADHDHSDTHDHAAEEGAAAARAAPTPGQPALPNPAEEGEAWRALPALQRSLAEPIRPAAPLDVFTHSLTAHQNPSFLAPLSHRVEPEAGGLVDGLADPTGRPLPYVAGGELTVPHTSSAAKPAVQRTIAQWATPFGERPAASGLGAVASVAEPVEVAVDQPPHLDTVSMERPVAGLDAERLVTGTGTPTAPLAVSVPAKPAAAPGSVQRHAGHDHDESEEAGEPAEGPTLSRLAGAIETPTVSRLAEPVPPAVVQRAAATDVVPVRATGEEAPTLGGGEDSSARTTSSTSVPPSAGDKAAHGPASATPQPPVRPEPAAMPVVGVQRQAAQPDLGFRRVWPVVPEIPAPTRVMPALPTLELPLSRLAEAGPSAEPDPPTAPAPAGAGGFTPEDGTAAPGVSAPSGPSASGETDAAEAPLSGFVAAISAIQGGGAVPSGYDESVGGLGGAAGTISENLGSAGAGPGHIPLQRLVGPGEVVRRDFEQPDGREPAETGQVAASFEDAGPEAPTLAGSALAAGTLHSTDGNEETGLGGTGELETGGAGEARRSYGSGPAPVVARIAADLDGGLPELPVVTTSPTTLGDTAPPIAAAVGGAASTMPVAPAPVQRSTASSAGRPTRTVDLVASRTPTLQLKALTSAAPVPEPIQRVTFLPGTTWGGGAGGWSHPESAQPHVLATVQRSAVAVSRPPDSAGTTTQPPVASASAQAGEPAVQRSIAFPGAPSHQAVAPVATAGFVRAGQTADPARTDASGSAGPTEDDAADLAAENREWHPATLEVAQLDDHPAAGHTHVETVPIQRVAAASSAATASARRGAITDVAGLETYQSVQRSQAQAARRQSTVMPPLPIVQRQAAPAEKPVAAPTPRSGGPVSFASLFAAASEASDSGYTTVQLLADDDSMPGDDAGAPTAADAAAPAVQREGEATPPSAPAPVGAAAPAGGAGPAGADLDEMARRLFDPLAARLRAEFWLDRERAGLMTDARP